MRHVFFINSNIDIQQLTLGEGAGFGWIPLTKVNDYDLTVRTKQDLDYFMKTLFSK